MLAHFVAFLSFATAAVGGLFPPLPARAPALTEDPLAYAETGTSTPSTLHTEAQSFVLPILVYHIVRPSYASDSDAVRNIAVTPEVFDAELAYLTEAGYTVTDFSALEAHLDTGAPLPAHPIILSFDDAWSNQYQYAFPLLKARGMTATFFVFTNALDHKGFLTWSELSEMIAAGMTVGDHSRSHPYLTRIASRETLLDEIVGSKQVLERRLGVPIREFAYPFGLHDATTTTLVKEAGFRTARGDALTGLQSPEKRFALSAQNAPTTLAAFKKAFPPQ